MLVPYHRLFVGRELDSDHVASYHSQLARKFARQESIKEKHITGNKDVQQAASTFVKALEELDFKRCIDVY